MHRHLPRASFATRRPIDLTRLQCQHRDGDPGPNTDNSSCCKFGVRILHHDFRHPIRDAGLGYHSYTMSGERREDRRETIGYHVDRLQPVHNME